MELLPWKCDAGSVSPSLGLNEPNQSSLYHSNENLPGFLQTITNLVRIMSFSEEMGDLNLD